MISVLAFALGLCIIWAITMTVLYATKFQDAPNPKWTEDEIRLLQHYPNGFVTFPRLGKFGRKGNQMFQMAAAIATGVAQNKPVRFHKWSYAPYYESQTHLYDFTPNMDLVRPNVFEPGEFHHATLASEPETIVALDGYWQHPAHFKGISAEIREAFRLKAWIFDHVREEYPVLTKAIGVHIRRGDYVNNPTHQVCTFEYFQWAVDMCRNGKEDTPVVLFSDDPAWCLREMAFLANCVVPTWHSDLPSEILDFASLQLCPYKVISNSTFGWWACWLRLYESRAVVVPYPWIRGQTFERSHDFACLYMPEWYVYDCDANTVIQRPFMPATSPLTLGAYGSRNETFQRLYPKSSVIEQSGTPGDFVQDFLAGARRIQEDWFVWLTDDVYIHRKPAIRLDSQYDVIAMTPSDSHATLDVWKPHSRTYIDSAQNVPRVESGSLFRTKFWATLDPDLARKQLEGLGDNPLGLLCSLNYGRILEASEDLVSGRVTNFRANPSIQNGVALHPTERQRLRIALIGPGVLTSRGGWGAIENLVDDYAKWLSRLPNVVCASTDSSDFSVVLQTLRNFAPNVIHVQYDDYVAWIPSLQAEFPEARILFTLHHSYLLNQSRWEGYKSIVDSLNAIDKTRVVAVALSPAIRAFFKVKGFRWIYTQPNCADHEKIAFAPTHCFPDRSICLAKICTRKGQARVAHDTSVWFAGPIADETFASHDRWLGEWSRSDVESKLTHYANLVLLSDGEADPLVVKEAMMAGLGLVLTRCAAANLDLHCPWIHVVEDGDNVSELIAQNREVALMHREAIRAYALEHFSYQARVESYADFLRHWISK